MVAFFCRFCLNDKKLLPWALNYQKISHFKENDKKKVPWAVVYQNDGLRWISPRLVSISLVLIRDSPDSTGTL